MPARARGSPRSARRAPGRTVAPSSGRESPDPRPARAVTEGSRQRPSDQHPDQDQREGHDDNGVAGASSPRSRQHGRLRPRRSARRPTTATTQRARDTKTRTKPRANAEHGRQASTTTPMTDEIERGHPTWADHAVESGRFELGQRRVGGFARRKGPTRTRCNVAPCPWSPPRCIRESRRASAAWRQANCAEAGRRDQRRHLHHVTAAGRLFGRRPWRSLPAGIGLLRGRPGVRRHRRSAMVVAGGAGGAGWCAFGAGRQLAGAVARRRCCAGGASLRRAWLRWSATASAARYRAAATAVAALHLRIGRLGGGKAGSMNLPLSTGGIWIETSSPSGFGLSISQEQRQHAPRRPARARPRRRAAGARGALARIDLLVRATSGRVFAIERVLMQCGTPGARLARAAAATVRNEPKTIILSASAAISRARPIRRARVFEGRGSHRQPRPVRSRRARNSVDRGRAARAAAGSRPTTSDRPAA